MRLLVSLWKMFCYTAGTVVIGLAVYEFWFLAQILYWVEHNPATTRVMDARLEALRQNRRSGALDHKWVDYQGISIHLKRAIIIAEDAKFVDHEGFDWEGIQRAMGKNLRRGKIVAGGSTITQQLAKNLFLSGERSLLRKGQEAILTAMLEAAMDKRRIAARLAAMLPRPRYYDRNRGSVYLENYSESILEQMPAAQIP